MESKTYPRMRHTVDSCALTSASSLTPCSIFPTAPASCSADMVMGLEASTRPQSMKYCNRFRFSGT